MIVSLSYIRLKIAHIWAEWMWTMDVDMHVDGGRG